MAPQLERGRETAVPGADDRDLDAIRGRGTAAFDGGAASHQYGASLKSARRCLRQPSFSSMGRLGHPRPPSGTPWVASRISRTPIRPRGGQRTRPACGDPALDRPACFSIVGNTPPLSRREGMPCSQSGRRGPTMTFREILAEVLELLQRQGRVSYRGAQAPAALDDDYKGGPQGPSSSTRNAWPSTRTQGARVGGRPRHRLAGTEGNHKRAPAVVTPIHLVEKILNSREASRASASRSRCSSPT